MTRPNHALQRGGGRRGGHRCSLPASCVDGLWSRARVADHRLFRKRAKVSGRRNRAVGVISGMIILGMSGV